MQYAVASQGVPQLYKALSPVRNMPGNIKFIQYIPSRRFNVTLYVTSGYGSGQHLYFSTCLSTEVDTSFHSGLEGDFETSIVRLSGLTSKAKPWYVQDPILILQF